MNTNSTQAKKGSTVRFYFLFVLLLLPVTVWGSAPADGFIYGTVTWPDGVQLTGFIRWEKEEAFWDDLFHTGYRHNPWAEHVDLEKLSAQKHSEYYESHGLLDRVIYYFEKDDEDAIGWRMLLIRYGDIKTIEINDGKDDFLITADGSRHQIGGYGNDSGADLVVYGRTAGPGSPFKTDDPTEIEWNDLTQINFAQAPADANPYGQRAYGVVESTGGQFEGHIQWDLSECVSSDILDGRLDGKNKDFLLGDVRSIARAEKENASVVELKDGSVTTLGGSNDLNSGNRGIMVENPQWGRVIIPWKRFQKATFIDGKGSGPTRDSYNNGGPLRGTVTLRDGSTATGRLVFDLDEGWQWDIFNGTWEEIDFNIPFPLIKSIEPAPEDDEPGALVTLHNGHSWLLTDNQDTGKENGGVLVFGQESAPAQHLMWADIQSIEMEP